MATTTLPSLPPVAGTDPSRAVLDSFRIAIAKKVADAVPPLTIEQVYAGVDYTARQPPTLSCGVREEGY